MNDNDREIEERRSGLPDRRAEPEKVFTPQFVWQIVTWLFMQVIAGAVLYNVLTTRLTVVEVKQQQQNMLEARVIVLEKEVEYLKAVDAMKTQTETLQQILKLLVEEHEEQKGRTNAGQRLP